MPDLDLSLLEARLRSALATTVMDEADALARRAEPTTPGIDYGPARADGHRPLQLSQHSTRATDTTRTVATVAYHRPWAAAQHEGHAFRSDGSEWIVRRRPGGGRTKWLESELWVSEVGIANQVREAVAKVLRTS